MTQAAIPARIGKLLDGCSCCGENTTEDDVVSDNLVSKEIYHHVNFAINTILDGILAF